MVHFHMRGETKPQERRTAVVPEDAKKLVEAGHTFTVERFPDRCYPDKEYEAAGCKLMASGTWLKDAPHDAVILGLKELPESKSALPHRHIMFAHCFKNQDGWKDVMQRFIDGKGQLYDLEFLKDEAGRRKVAFGRSAGFCGMGAGILAWAHQHSSQHPMTRLAFPGGVPFYPSGAAFIEQAKTSIASVGRAPKIMIIGALGRCGSGAVDMAMKAGVPEDNILKWDMKETAKGGPFKEILDVDIFVNCIYLDPASKTPPFLTKELLQMEGRQLSLMVDVSCDPNNPANPVPVYSECTTFNSPVLRVLHPAARAKVKAKKDMGTPGFGKTCAKGDTGVVNDQAEVVMDGTGAVFDFSTTSFETAGPVSKPFDVIAIDHLPSLVPSESSDEFSHGLLPLLLDFAEDKEGVWKRALEVYEEKRKELAA